MVKFTEEALIKSVTLAINVECDFSRAERPDIIYTLTSVSYLYISNITEVLEQFRRELSTGFSIF